MPLMIVNRKLGHGVGGARQRFKKCSLLTSTEHRQSSSENSFRLKGRFKSEIGKRAVTILNQVLTDLQEVEQQQQSEADLAREKIEELERALDDEKRKKEACEQQIQQQLQASESSAFFYLLLIGQKNYDWLQFQFHSLSTER